MVTTGARRAAHRLTARHLKSVGIHGIGIRPYTVSLGTMRMEGGVHEPRDEQLGKDPYLSSIWLARQKTPGMYPARS